MDLTARQLVAQLRPATVRGRIALAARLTYVALTGKAPR